jgi:hypothetical protein
MLCILYVIGVTTLLGVVGLMAERVLPASFPRRWMWCAIMITSVALPGYNRYHYTLSITTPLWERAESHNSIIGPLWTAASWLIVLWGMIAACRVAWLIHTARKAGMLNEAPTVVDGVPVLVTDKLGPATVGVLRSHVLVPRWVLALPAVQRRYVLCHEEQHRKAHDSLVLFIASLPLVVMPWNVALWWQIKRLSLAVEMDCDNRVVSALGNARAYGELLLRVAEVSSPGPRLQPALLGASMLEKRLTVLLAPTRLRNIQKIFLPVLAAGLLLLVLSMPHPVLGHMHDHATMTSNR